MPVAFCEIDKPKASLPEGETHVYSCPIRGAESLLSSLNAEERARAARFRVERMREQFIVARGQLRTLLAHYLGLLPGEIPLQYEEQGKPHLPPEFGLHFNLSHTDGLAIFALSRDLVGIDVERVRSLPEAENLVARFFSKREGVEFLALHPEARSTGFMRAWTRKEAVLKALGRGVLALDTCEVTFAEDEPARVRCLDGDYSAGADWELEAWEPAAGYLAAIAVKTMQARKCKMQNTK